MFTFEHIVVAALANINSPGLEIIFFVAFCPPYWISDLLPVICIVFQQPIKTAPRTDLSRVARFVNPCAVRNEDSRHEIVLKTLLHPQSAYSNELDTCAFQYIGPQNRREIEAILVTRGRVVWRPVVSIDDVTVFR